MSKVKVMDTQNCFHCGLNIIKKEAVLFDEKAFCCPGCKTVYEIFSLNDMACYYDFLDNESIVSKLLEFHEKKTTITSLNIPHIHCSSCIWILENLQKLQQGISTSQVNFPEKKVRITYNPETVSLKTIVCLLSSIGYEPYISLENYETGKNTIDRS